MPNTSFFATYDTAWMQVLNRAYFNQLGKMGKYQPLVRYQQPGDGFSLPKPFLYSYRNLQQQKFSVFIPCSLEDDIMNYNAQYSMLLKDALGFIYDYAKRRSKNHTEDEQFLIPLMDHAQKHWSILSVILTHDNQYIVKHYDGAIKKNKTTQNEIRHVVHELLGAQTTFPFLARQLDTINCGPFSHRLMRDLAQGKKPSILPCSPFHYRSADFKLIAKASALNQSPEIVNHNHFPFFAFEHPKKPFWVRHRRKLIIGIVAVAVALTVAALIAGPFAPLVLAATTSIGLSVASLAGIGGSAAGLATIFGGTAIAALARGYQTLKRIITQKQKPHFVYNEAIFEDKTKNYQPSAEIKMKIQSIPPLKGPSPQLDYLQMSEIEISENNPLRNIPSKSSPNKVASEELREALGSGGFVNLNVS